MAATGTGAAVGQSYGDAADKLDRFVSWELKDKDGKVLKTYISLFTCAIIRAVVEDLSVNVFLRVLPAFQNNIVTFRSKRSCYMMAIN